MSDKGDPRKFVTKKVFVRLADGRHVCRIVQMLGDMVVAMVPSEEASPELLALVSEIEVEREPIGFLSEQKFPEEPPAISSKKKILRDEDTESAAVSRFRSDFLNLFGHEPSRDLEEAIRAMVKEDQRLREEVYRLLDSFTIRTPALPAPSTAGPTPPEKIDFSLRVGEGHTVQTSSWTDGVDKLFGPYRERRIEVNGGRCFTCGGEILKGPARERERGGMTMVSHVECPKEVVKKGKRR